MSGQQAAKLGATQERRSAGQTIEEARRKEVARSRGVHDTRHLHGRHFDDFIAPLYDGTPLSVLYHSYPASPGKLGRRLMGPLAGKDTGFVGIGKDEVGLLRQVDKKVVVRLHNVVARQIQTDLKARRMSQVEGPVDKRVILDEVTFDINVEATPVGRSDETRRVCTPCS